MFYTQIIYFIEPTLPKYQAAFRKNHNTQHELLKMIETWRSMGPINNWGPLKDLHLDLSNVFDTLNHKRLLCKLKFMASIQNV